MLLWIVLVIAVLIVIAVIGIYNALIKSKLRADEAWSDITVQLKRRADLIPNLVNTVKGYAKHESKVFEKVTEARSAIMGATKKGPAEAAAAENQFQTALKSLFAVAEAYPDLKANANFQDLQQELVDTEDKIEGSRRYYNGAVRDFNMKLQVFPTNMIGNMLGFKSREFFDVDENEKESIKKPTEVNFE
jgi:LemA protein